MKKHESELPTRYDPKPVEEKWYRYWNDSGFFHTDPDGRESYCIVIPPPNVTAVLHMGQALNNTIQDILIRWNRMRGYNTLWVPGVDHAAIATQNVVERELAKEGLSRHDLGREEFVKRVLAWKDKYGSAIIDQLKKLGCSCDWQRERFTMDEGLSRAVREAFIKLYDRGLIYRGKYIINWCPRCETALSDDEVEREEHQGHLWYIRYPLQDADGAVTVATTRPETMLGDVAVAVHPDDERYTKLVGENVILPIMNRPIPLIADPAVEKEFGTGALKITPAHDPVDFEIAQRHNLDALQVMNTDGTMNENAGKHAGEDRFKCRELVVAELKEAGLLQKIEDYTLPIGQCYRCGTIIEPYLSDQWFVKTRPLAEKAIEASRGGRVRFHPARWERVYLSWLENVRDWCISRQIWFGHRIPIWYCQGCGEIIASSDTPSECQKCGSEDLEQDEDVLDTWFSSALWPFSTLGWPDDTPDLRYYYPTSTLVTDRGIIYLWVGRMVMMGLEMIGDIPFSDVYIHATVQDKAGRRMSKSLGTGIDPLDMIGVYGTDALRYSIMMLTSEGQDVKLWEERFEMGRNFANKLWNASRFSLSCLAEASSGISLKLSPEASLAYEDRWILSRLNSVIESYTRSLESYQFHRAAHTIYEFAWHEFCDWYLEMIKPRVAASGEDADRTLALSVLARVLSDILLLLHPFTPYITEEIWQRLRELLPNGELGESVMLGPWPESDAAFISQPIDSEMALLQEIVRGVRNIRNKMNITDRAPLRALVAAPDAGTKQLVLNRSQLLRQMAGLKELEVDTGLQKPKASAVEVIGQLDLFVPLEGIIDFKKERERLEHRRAKVRDQLQSLEKQLGSSGFLSKAPPDIVQSRRQRKADLESQLSKLNASLEDLPSD